MKKILIIVRDFVPYYRNLGGVIRILKMAEFLLSRGIEVFVLSAKGSKISYFGYEELVKKLKVYYVADSLQEFMSARHKNQRFLLRDSPLEFLFRKINYEVSTPDKGIYFINRYVKAAVEIINANSIKNVLVSSPAHSTQVIGLRLKEKLGERINLIVEYRDGWNTSGIFAKRTPLFRMISENMEKNVLKKADYFVYIAPAVLGMLNQKYFDITNKSILIMSGYDQGLNGKADMVKNEILTIGFFGTIFNSVIAHRDPGPLFEAVLKMGKRVKLFFCGDIYINKRWRERMGSVLEVKNQVSREEAFGLMRKMDALLILHSEKYGAKEAIGGKFWEYIAARRPVIVAGPPDMGAAMIVNERKLGYAINIFDEDDMAKKLSDIYDEWQEGRMVSYGEEQLEGYNVESQYSKLLPVLR